MKTHLYVFHCMLCKKAVRRWDLRGDAFIIDTRTGVLLVKHPNHTVMVMWRSTAWVIATLS